MPALDRSLCDRRGKAHLTIPNAATLNREQTNATSSWMGSSNLARSTFAVGGGLPLVDDHSMPEPACGNVRKS